MGGGAPTFPQMGKLMTESAKAKVRRKTPDFALLFLVVFYRIIAPTVCVNFFHAFASHIGRGGGVGVGGRLGGRGWMAKDSPDPFGSFGAWFSPLQSMGVAVGGGGSPLFPLFQKEGGLRGGGGVGGGGRGGGLRGGG